VDLLARIRSQFGVDLPAETLFHSPTIERLAHKVQEHFNRLTPQRGSRPSDGRCQAPTLSALAARLDAATAPSTSLIVPFGSGGDRPAVFAIHDGAGYFLFWRFAAELGRNRPVYAVQADTGFNGKATPYLPCTSVEALAARYIREI